MPASGFSIRIALPKSVEADLNDIWLDKKKGEKSLPLERLVYRWISEQVDKTEAEAKQVRTQGYAYVSAIQGATGGVALVRIEPGDIVPIPDGTDGGTGLLIPIGTHLLPDLRDAAAYTYARELKKNRPPTWSDVQGWCTLMIREAIDREILALHKKAWSDDEAELFKEPEEKKP